jgi:hypothetical protein
MNRSSHQTEMLVEFQMKYKNEDFIKIVPNSKQCKKHVFLQFLHPYSWLYKIRQHIVLCRQLTSWKVKFFYVQIFLHHHSVKIQVWHPLRVFHRHQREYIFVMVIRSVIVYDARSKGRRSSLGETRSMSFSHMALHKVCVSSDTADPQ